jgi:thioredoxin reductase
MTRTPIVIVGSGPFGLSLAAHLGAQNVEHRIFGRPMQFWSQIAEAGSGRYLKSFCFATSLSSPKPGYTFADFNAPRGLETFEPCSMSNFVDYGRWFQQHNVPWTEQAEVVHVESTGEDFRLTLSNGERLAAWNVVVATGLANFDYTPPVLASLPPELVIHSSRIRSFSHFAGKTVAVIGAGQSALEASALLLEAGAEPHLLVREGSIRWHTRTSQERSIWQRIRAPLSGFGVGPRAWGLSTFPGATQRLPHWLRLYLTQNYLPPEGAWWLRARLEDRVPVQFSATVARAEVAGSHVALQLRIGHNSTASQLIVDHVVAATGYDVNLDRLVFLDSKLRSAINRLERSAKLNSVFETSVPGLHFIGPTSALNFGPLFRFVAGADYTARVLSADLSARISSRTANQVYAAA